MIEQQFADSDLLDTIDKEIETQTDAAVKFGLDAPYPDADEVDMHIYA